MFAFIVDDASYRRYRAFVVTTQLDQLTFEMNQHHVFHSNGRGRYRVAPEQSCYQSQRQTANAA